MEFLLAIVIVIVAWLVFKSLIAVILAAIAVGVVLWAMRQAGGPRTRA